MLERFLDYVAGHDGVHFTTCADYVSHWREGRALQPAGRRGDARSAAWDV